MIEFKILLKNNFYKIFFVGFINIDKLKFIVITL